MEKTYYQIKYKKKLDSVPKWYLKGTYRTKAEAERFMDVLSQVSDIYSELKVEPITIKEEAIA